MARYHPTPAQTAAKNALKALFDDCYRHLRNDVVTKLSELDPADPETLTVTVGALLDAKFEQKQVAEWLGVSRTTIGRWALQQNIPRSPVFRKWAFDTLRKHLADAVGTAKKPAGSSASRTRARDGTRGKHAHSPIP